MNKNNFMKSVQKTETCWNWSKYIKKNGYGTITLHAHQLSFLLFKGQLPQGLQIHHLCNNRKCVKPDHLKAITQSENIKLSNGISVINARKTHCLRGHKFDAKNTRIDKNRQRHCIKCDKIRRDKSLKRKINSGEIVV